MRVPQTSLGWRLLTFAWGAAVFGWLMLEDDRVSSVVVLALGAATLTITTSILERYGGQVLKQGHSAVLLTIMGGMIGAGSAALTATFMFLKTAIHSHLYPDYPVGIMLAMLERVPAWGIVGILLGLCLWLIAYACYGVSSLSA